MTFYKCNHIGIIRSSINKVFCGKIIDLEINKLQILMKGKNNSLSVSINNGIYCMKSLKMLFQAKAAVENLILPTDKIFVGIKLGVPPPK